MKITKEHLYYICADNNKSNRDKLSTICNSVGIKCLKDEGFKFIEIYSCDGGAADEFELLDTDNPESTSRFFSSDDIDEMLRAAALEGDCKKQLADIAASIGAQLITPKKKPRTKVEYVKSDIESRGRALDAFDGEIELFELVNGEYEQVTTESDAISKWRNLYRRIETPMTEREAFVDALNDLFHSHTMSTSDLFNAIVDSGKFKLVN